jgi:hypothetical protein
LPQSCTGNPGTTAVSAVGHLQVSNSFLQISSIVASESSTDKSFVTVLRKKRGKPYFVFPFGLPSPLKQTWDSMIGIKMFLSPSALRKWEKKLLFFCFAILV